MIHSITLLPQSVVIRNLIELTTADLEPPGAAVSGKVRRGVEGRQNDREAVTAAPILIAKYNYIGRPGTPAAIALRTSRVRDPRSRSCGSRRERPRCRTDRPPHRPAARRRLRRRRRCRRG